MHVVDSRQAPELLVCGELTRDRGERLEETPAGAMSMIATGRVAPDVDDARQADRVETSMAQVPHAFQSGPAEAHLVHVTGILAANMTLRPVRSAWRSITSMTAPKRSANGECADHP